MQTHQMCQKVLGTLRIKQVWLPSVVAALCQCRRDVQKTQRDATLCLSTVTAGEGKVFFVAFFFLPQLVK